MAPSHEPSAKVGIAELGRAGDRGALAHYDDPRYYTKTYGSRSDDVAYYVRLARLSGGPVLEYGVGNGRIALPIARAGVEAVGVDLSKPMLADLRERLAREPRDVGARLHIAAGDMRNVRLHRRFPLVIAPFNVLLHLYEREDLERFLARVREHLAARGRFVFDVSVPRLDNLNCDPDRKYRAPRIRHPTTGELVRYSERFEYDPLRQLLLITMEFEPESGGLPWLVPLTHRQYFPRELEALLHYNGFGDLVLSADFKDEPPTPRVDSLVVSCRARTKGARLAGRPRRA